MRSASSSTERAVRGEREKQHRGRAVQWGARAAAQIESRAIRSASSGKPCNEERKQQHSREMRSASSSIEAEPCDEEREQQHRESRAMGARAAAQRQSLTMRSASSGTENLGMRSESRGTESRAIRSASSGKPCDDEERKQLAAAQGAVR